MMEDKVSISIEKFEELLCCKFKLEVLEEDFKVLQAEKHEAEIGCEKYRRLYEAKLKQEAEEMKERIKGKHDEDKPLGSGKREEDQGSKN